MPATDFDLSRLLLPVEQEVFFRDHWEKKPLLIPRQEPGYYRRLFSLADVDEVIAFSRPKFLEPGVTQPAESGARYVQGWLPDQESLPTTSYPGIAELRRLYLQGKTIILKAMQHRWPAIAALARSLEGVFECPVHANLYLTPEGAQGFDPHYDTHEVFVLQLAGFKHWRLYGPARTLPLVGAPLGVPRECLGEAQEVRLEEGDLLYIPRGHTHEAFTSECASLHLTVGINIYRWVDLLHLALEQVSQEEVGLRESLPRGLLSATELPEGVSVRFRELLQVVARTARCEDAFRRLGDQFLEQLRPLPGNTFVPPAGLEALDLNTVVEKRAGVLCRVLQEGDGVVIEAPGSRMSGPLKIAAALRFVASHDRFAVRALPDDLSSNSKLVLARRLVREGFLQVASDPAL